MIPESKLKEIRNYLEKSENPLFFFDNDPDGLCSYLLLKKKYNKGKGICTIGVLDEKFIRKVKEYSPDLIVVLDKPIITQEFVDETNVPILWIDHHPVLDVKGVHYYNSLMWKTKNNKPVSYWCHKITKREEDLWLAAVGSVFDWQLTDISRKFSKKYPDLLPQKIKHPSDAIFETNLGELIHLFIFLLKGQTSEVRTSINVLMKIKEPYELLNQTTPQGKYLFKKIKKVKNSYDQLFEKAMSEVPKEELFVFYMPPVKFAMTGNIANNILHFHRDKVILIAREKDEKINISSRALNHNLQKIFEKAVEGMKNARGGGHVHACGGEVNKEDFPEFLKRFKEGLKKW